jgi:hypothetical protein
MVKYEVQFSTKQNSGKIDLSSMVLNPAFSFLSNLFSLGHLSITKSDESANVSKDSLSARAKEEMTRLKGPRQREASGVRERSPHTTGRIYNH